MTETNVNMKDIYQIIERGEGQRPLWTRIGVAFVNKDSSLNLFLDSVPLNGKLHVRDRKPKTKENNYENAS
ncbi:hypothetical protein KKA47_01965 [bacterium]|nr:hypothetical protein [bacterium]